MPSHTQFKAVPVDQEFQVLLQYHINTAITGVILKQLLTFVEVNMFVCRPENPILTEAIPGVCMQKFVMIH